MGQKFLACQKKTRQKLTEYFVQKVILRTPMFTAKSLQPEMSRESGWGQTSILCLLLVHG